MAGLPLRMNTTVVRIQRLSETRNVPSSVFKGPTALKNYSEPEDFRAQVQFRAEERRNRQLLGDVPFTAGYLVYRAPTDAAKRLKKGDKIVGLPDGAGGFDEVDYVVVENTRHGNLPDPLLYFASFARNEDVVNSP